jgi:hypothetical protein
VRGPFTTDLMNSRETCMGVLSKVKQKADLLAKRVF